MAEQDRTTTAADEPLLTCGNPPFGAPLRPDAALPGQEPDAPPAPAAGPPLPAGMAAPPAAPPLEPIRLPSPRRAAAQPPDGTDRAGQRQGGTNKWAAGSEVRVGFYEPPGNWWYDRLRALVWQGVTEWAKYANLNFSPVQGKGDITISFGLGQVNTVNSQLGTDSANATPSMYLHFDHARGSDPGYQQYMWAIVLHEFGHALGMVHEHQLPRQGMPFTWDPNMAGYYKQQYPGASDAYIQNDILRPYQAGQLTDWVTFDRDSIMMYPIPHGCAWYADGSPMVVGQNTALSDADKQFIARMYPGRYPPEPGGGGGNGGGGSGGGGGGTTLPPEPDRTLTLGTEVTDFLAAAGDTREYRFDLDAEAEVRVRVSGGGPKRGRLLGPDDTTVPLLPGDEGDIDKKRTIKPGAWRLEVSLDDGANAVYTVRVTAG